MTFIPLRIYAIMAAALAFVLACGWIVLAIRDNAVLGERARNLTNQAEKVDAAKTGADRVLGGDDSRVRGFDRD